MRLNRVLQLTAGVAIAMVATIFTISCSGDEGSSGNDGAACVVKEASDGTYDIVCGGSVVGSLVGGHDGAQGQQGPQGIVGNACTIGTQQADGSYPIYCGSTTPAGTLNGCAFTKSTLDPTYDVVITCGGTTFGLCSGVTYNPSDEYCDLTSHTKTTIETVCVSGTTKTKFNPAKQYCGYDNKAALTAKTPTVLDLCSSDLVATDLDSAQLNSASLLPNTTTEYGYQPADTVLYDGTNGKWKNKYCKVSVTLANDSLEYTKAPSDSVNCDGKGITPNKNTWQGQYCGYAGNTPSNGLLKTMVDGACADGEGPHAEVYNKRYCWMEEKTSKYTTISDVFCETPDGPLPINKVDNKILTTSSDFKGEYCGYASKEDAAAIKISRLTGLCDDGVGPNAGSWTNDYCQADKDGFTTKVGGISAYCLKAGESYDTADVETARINWLTWQDQYCGYSNKEANDSLVKTVQTGVCDNGSGPNAEAWNNEYCRAGRDGKTFVSGEHCGITEAAATADLAGSVNQGTWKNQYCGYASKEDFEAKIQTVLTGVCNTDGTNTDIGPNAFNNKYTAWLNEYCQSDSTGITTVVGTGAAPITDAYCLSDTTGADYDAAPASARINENTWKSEYCGFASKADLEAETKVFSKLTGICDDGGAPNSVASSSWVNEYCQVKEDDKLTGLTTKVGGGASTVYCSETADVDFADLSAEYRLNEKTWKGEYCFADKVKGVCTGGKVPASTSTNSDAPNRCSYPN